MAKSPEELRQVVVAEPVCLTRSRIVPSLRGKRTQITSPLDYSSCAKPTKDSLTPWPIKFEFLW